jgi:hypothetical protein
MRDVRIGELNPWAFVVATAVFLALSLAVYKQIPFGTAPAVAVTGDAALQTRVIALESEIAAGETRMQKCHNLLSELDGRMKVVEDRLRAASAPRRRTR